MKPFERHSLVLVPFPFTDRTTEKRPPDGQNGPEPAPVSIAPLRDALPAQRGSSGRTRLIDEVQYAPSLFRHLKTAVDADRKACGTGGGAELGGAGAC